MAFLIESVELIGSIGTFGLALAAYWNIFKPLKPKIIISFGTKGEYFSENKDELTTISSLDKCVLYYFYRLKVENDNKFISSCAKKLYLRFMAISSMVDDDKWEELTPFNPFTMRWTSTTDNYNAFYSDLAKGEYLYANFFTVKNILSNPNCTTIESSEIIPGHEGIKYLALAAGFPREKLKNKGTFRFKIGVFGENIKGKEFCYEVKFEAGQNIDQSKVNIRQL